MFENMSVVNNIIKEESRKNIRESVGVYIEKVVVKVENCTFQLVIITKLAGDALSACVVYLELV